MASLLTTTQHTQLNYFLLHNMIKKEIIMHFARLRYNAHCISLGNFVLQAVYFQISEDLEKRSVKSKNQTKIFQNLR